MITAIYRISSGEVLKISAKGQPFDDRDVIYWGVLTDATLTDGSSVRDPSGNFRVLGYAKIALPGTNTIRNATQLEIDTFEGHESNDENIIDADEAKNLFNSHPRFRRLFVAFASILVDEINILRANDSLAPRTLAQLKTAINNRISKDD